MKTHHLVAAADEDSDGLGVVAVLNDKHAVLWHNRKWLVKVGLMAGRHKN